MNQQRVITYIDGYNLYHGLLEAGLRSSRWLDLPKLGQRPERDRSRNGRRRKGGRRDRGLGGPRRGRRNIGGRGRRFRFSRRRCRRRRRRQARLGGSQPRTRLARTTRNDKHNSSCDYVNSPTARHHMPSFWLTQLYARESGLRRRRGPASVVLPAQGTPAITSRPNLNARRGSHFASTSRRGALR